MKYCNQICVRIRAALKINSVMFHKSFHLWLFPPTGLISQILYDWFSDCVNLSTVFVLLRIISAFYFDVMCYSNWLQSVCMLNSYISDLVTTWSAMRQQWTCTLHSDLLVGCATFTVELSTDGSSTISAAAPRHCLNIVPLATARISLAYLIPETWWSLS